MKKQLIILSCAFLLASCDGGNVASSNVPSSSEGSTDSSVSSSEATGFTPFKTMSALMNHLVSEGDDLEDASGKKATRHFETKTIGIQGDSYRQKVTEATVLSYSDPAKVLTAEVVTKNVSPNYENENWEHKDRYDEVLVSKENTFYDVIDYANNIDNEDKVVSYAIGKDISQSEITKSTNLGLCHNLYKGYLEPYVLPDLIAGADDIEAKLASDGSFSYEGKINKITAVDSYGYRYKDTGEYTITFSNTGMLLSYSFHLLEESAYGESSEEWGLSSEVLDEFAIVDAGKKEAFSSLPLNPLDYYMTDYEVGVYTDDGLGQSDSLQAIDPKSFPINTRLRVLAKNVTPTKALDTDLEILSSSDNAIVSVSNGVATSVALGSCTLTVISESGIKKTVDVTVVNPSLKSIRLWTAGSRFYVGDEVTVFVNKDPEANVDELEASLNVGEDVATLTVTTTGNYDIQTKKACQDLVLTVSSKNNPEVRQSIHLNIRPKLEAAELQASIKGKTLYSDYVYNGKTYEKANEIHFGEDGKGYFMNKEKEQGLLFEVNKKYEFTYEETESDYRGYPKITFSSLTVQSGDSNYVYDDNYAYIQWDGTLLNVYFNLADYNMYYFNFTGDFYFAK